MNISVIFTGGTIGSLKTENWVGVDNSAKYMLLSKFENKFNDVVFIPSAPYGILSENLSANELNTLQKEVENVLQSGTDGIIITHGTDTLQYSASAIEYAFANTQIPIVFVSAAYPLDNPKTNGFDNFNAAVELIRSKQTKGVFVSYKNDGENGVRIHIASRIFQHREDDANIYSTDGSTVAEYSNNSLTFFEAKKNKCVYPLGKVDYAQFSNILTIESTPANEYNYSFENVKAVILKPYHSATLNTSNERLAEFCKKAHEKNIPIFVPTVRKGVAYESSKLFNDLKIVCPPYCTFVSLYMKIYAAISLNANIVNFVNKQISHEIIV